MSYIFKKHTQSFEIRVDPEEDDDFTKSVFKMLCAFMRIRKIVPSNSELTLKFGIALATNFEEEFISLRGIQSTKRKSRAFIPITKITENDTVYEMYSVKLADLDKCFGQHVKTINKSNEAIPGTNETSCCDDSRETL